MTFSSSWYIQRKFEKWWQNLQVPYLKVVAKEIEIRRTLYNVILRIPRNLLETRENVKILTHPFYHTNLDWFLWEWSKKKSKWPFFKMAVFQKCLKFLKLSQIGPRVSRIDCCEGHWSSSTYMVVRLSDIRAKIGKKGFFLFL